MHQLVDEKLVTSMSLSTMSRCTSSLAAAVIWSARKSVVLGDTAQQYQG